jgi:hypothetical protein
LYQDGTTHLWNCTGTSTTPVTITLASGTDPGTTTSPPTYNPSLSSYNLSVTGSTAFLVNTHNYSGQMRLGVNSSIIDATNNALVINSTGNNSVAHVYVNGTIKAGYASGNFSDVDADAISYTGANKFKTVALNLTTNSIPNEIVEGSDDGVYINPLDVTVAADVTNYGVIEGMGHSGDTSNASEGIHISAAGTTNSAGHGGSGNQITGTAEVDNYGTIAGMLEHSALSTSFSDATAATAGGQGVDVSAKGDITLINGGIVNSVNYDDASITGTEGVFAYGGGTNAITLTNLGHIQGTNGDGANLSNAASITVDNHSLGSMIGATNGQELSYSNTASYDNSGGLTAGLSGSD